MRLPAIPKRISSSESSPVACGEACCSSRMNRSSVIGAAPMTRREPELFLLLRHVPDTVRDRSIPFLGNRPEGSLDRVARDRSLERGLHPAVAARIHVRV